MVRFDSFRDMIRNLARKEDYYMHKNPAKKIVGDVKVGKEKTVITISFEIETRQHRAVKRNLKRIKQMLRENKG